MNGQIVTAPSGCHDTLAQEMASFGDFAGFDRLPRRFVSPVWFCVSEQLRVGGAWGDPSPALATTPARACASATT